MVAVWDFNSFWQFDIIFAQCLIIMHLLNRYKAYKGDKSNFVLRGCYLLSLLRPMLPSDGGFAISLDGYFLICDVK